MTQGFAYRIFCWIAGVDRTLLDACSDYEKNRQSSMGLLILMPVIMGFISMTFAIYAISKNLCISCIIGLIWSGFILIIDRYLVSTYVKAEHKQRDLRSIIYQTNPRSVINLIIRIVFAFGVGLSVSHPLVLFIFDETIQKYIVKADIAESEAFVKSNREQTKGDSLHLLQLEKDYQSVLNYENCVASALEKESTSTEKITTSCSYQIEHSSFQMEYSSSGRPNAPNQVGPNTMRIRGDLQSARENTKQVKAEKERLENKLQSKDSLVSEKREKTEKAASNDYLTRAVTLTKLESDPQVGSTVSTIKKFLLAFFIFVDLIPLIFKMLLKYGEYDQKISEMEILRRYLSNYQYRANRELGRLSIDQVFRFQRQKIRELATMTFNSIEELIAYLKKFKLWYDFSSNKTKE